MASPLLKRPRAAAAWLLAPQLPAVARGSRGLQPSASEKGGSSSRSSSQPPAIARSERQRILWRCKKESACLGSTPERVRDRRKDRQAGQGRDAPEKHAIVSGRSPRRKPGDSAWRRRPFSIQGNVAASGRMSMASGMMFTPGVPGLPPGASWCCAWHPATQPNGSRDRRKLEELLDFSPCSGRHCRNASWRKSQRDETSAVPAGHARRSRHRRSRCHTKSVMAVSTTTAPSTMASSSGCPNGPPAHCHSGLQPTTTAAQARQRLGP